MTNKTRTVLSCNDWRKFTETMQSISFKNSKIKLSERSAEIVSQNGYPEKEILKLSIENPNLIFKSQYSLFSEDYSIWHIFEYSQGQVKEIGLRPSYTVPNYNLNIESFMGYNNHDELLIRAIEIFERIDRVRENENGDKYIDYESEITLTVEDEDFQMQLYKEESKIYYKVFKKAKETNILLIPIENEMDIQF